MKEKRRTGILHATERRRNRKILQPKKRGSRSSTCGITTRLLEVQMAVVVVENEFCACFLSCYREHHGPLSYIQHYQDYTDICTSV